ncbi:efflux RND transporter periplasmic adaptor subunit [Oceanicoccus sagamiensis]|uniref:Hemolysin D n=1 Tax=Oceanicoccus sagamiensis TaxID=716816 RepID=A0A1X9N7U7_9GAMM|nr:efflux RND transporter periplasmic adaptor subunit [Oceanicoccus sagamiensis]ARN73184.1 hemolysin D [Oceanicoccus sagamiensis]
MKEIMLPYIFIVWLLVKLGIVQWNLRNAVIIVGIGAFLSFTLFASHRFWSPADLTDSSTIKAPHAVLSPLVGEQIKSIHVVHNQKVKQGDLIYRLESATPDNTTESLKAEIAQQETLIAQYKRDIQRILKAPDTFTQRDEERIKTEKANAKLEIERLQAELKQAAFEESQTILVAPFDGQVSIANIAVGSRLGNMHIYDTSRKFLEMRIPEQSYRYIEKGQFAEFFLATHPGEIFRGRVHSLRTGTGEAMVSPRAADQQVRQHVGRNTGSQGRTVIIEFIEPEGYNLPIGATGSAWISANKPHPLLGFMDIIGAATVRLKSYKAYLSAL